MKPKLVHEDFMGMLNSENPYFCEVQYPFGFRSAISIRKDYKYTKL
jgi:hypothetical protein